MTKSSGGRSPSGRTEREVAGRIVSLSNLDKVLYPEAGFTKGDVIDYYLAVADVLLDHLSDRPLTLKRYPNGVTEGYFYEKQCPRHRPDWVRTVAIETSKKTIDFCVVDDQAGLAWVANLASLELHPLLARSANPSVPTKITFDLDPGAPATVEECCVVALELRDVLDHLGLRSYPKTSGSKGVQVEVPLNPAARSVEEGGGATYGRTKSFARAIAQIMEREHPAKVVSRMDKSLRTGKVLIDWSQNDESKTTVCAYSLRAMARPTVSTPVTWEEVAAGAEGEPMVFDANAVIERIERLGDLQAPVATLVQELPGVALSPPAPTG